MIIARVRRKIPARQSGRKRIRKFATGRMKPSEIKMTYHIHQNEFTPGHSAHPDAKAVVPERAQSCVPA